MFLLCKELTAIDVSGFNTQNVKDMGAICLSLYGDAGGSPALHIIAQYKIILCIP